MSRPWKHPKTGVYWLRKRVPTAFAPLVGKAVVSRSLRTRDLEEAKRLHALALLALDDEWNKLRDAGQADAPTAPMSLNEREAHERSAWLFGSWLGQHRDDPSKQTFWPTDLYARLWSPTSLLTDALALQGEARLKAIGEARRVQRLEEWCLEQADDQAAARNWALDSGSRLLLAKALAAAVQRASVQLEKEARGEFTSPRLRATTNVTLSPSSAASASIKGMFEGWWREAKAAGRKPSTYESYRNTIKSFRQFIDHDDAARISSSDVVRFKDHRLNTPSTRTGKIPSAKTVKDSDLSALKAVFGWAANNHLITNNPAKGITIKVGKPRRLRSKGFSDDEAHALLSAALSHDAADGRTSAAKRWVPWLCAFTGARVGEIAQLRKQDVRQQNGRWLITITPEAGTVKNDQARDVVLHQQLIDFGFLDFVNRADVGHLFLRPGSDSEVRGPLRGLKNRLAEAARAIVPGPQRRAESRLAAPLQNRRNGERHRAAHPRRHTGTGTSERCGHLRRRKHPNHCRRNFENSNDQDIERITRRFVQRQTFGLLSNSTFLGLAAKAAMLVRQLAW